jgi:hypothetical protein
MQRRGIGPLEVPECLFVRDHALDLLREYLHVDSHGRFAYSGAAFDNYPRDCGCDAPDTIDNSDLISLTLLSIRVRGHHALGVTAYYRSEIRRLLTAIPAQARIDTPDSAPLLERNGPAWKLWELLRDIEDPIAGTKFGPVAAGKILARKRPHLVPISDKNTTAAFNRPKPRVDSAWWDDVRKASLNTDPVVDDDVTFWGYLGSLRPAANAEHLPVLRVLDILGWMWAERCASEPPSHGTDAVG